MTYTRNENELIPTRELEIAHQAIDDMLDVISPTSTADDIWASVLNNTHDDFAIATQHLALLLTVALQRLKAKS